MDTVNRITDSLNEKQLQAATTTEGYVRVTAGAGSGKTKALSHRFAYIVEELGISPSNVLCVTFTNKAAQEMRNRIRNLVSCGNINDFICTYHGFCVKLLREEIYRLCFQKNFVILDDEDQKGILKDIYEELGLTVKDLTYKKALGRVAAYKDSQSNFLYYIQYFLPKEIAKFNTEFSAPSPLVELYFKKQLKLTAFDFDDLINFTLYILLNFKESADKWQDKLHYIMVDETQDNSIRQWLLADLLSEKHNNLFIVGDPDQSIYEWRGARLEYFIDFDKTHQPCTDIIMDENYRSTPNILNVANCVIENNKFRIKKNLFTRKKEGSVVIHYHGKNEVEEGQWICKNIKKLLENGATSSQFAVLYRASYSSRYIEQALISSNLKYTIYNGTRFFERREVKDILSYLRLIANGDDLSFLRVVNTPSRKIGDVFKKNLAELAEKDGTSLYETLKAHISEESFNKTTAVDFIKLIEECRGYITDFSISDILEYVLKESGLKNMYRLEGDEDRLENIEELMHSVTLYEETNKEEESITLTDYLQDIALYTNLDYKEDDQIIKLMTIHQSKGLEFPYVFVIGMNEGSFPNHRSIRERKIKGLEEERRLAYVAFTRAEAALFLTESEGFDFSIKKNKYPSRFIGEIKKDYYVIEGIIPEEIINGAKNLIHEIDDELSRLTEPQYYKIGDLVKHPRFGNGIIESINEEQFKYYVKFDDFKDAKPFISSYRGNELQIKKKNIPEGQNEDLQTNCLIGEPVISLKEYIMEKEGNV